MGAGNATRNGKRKLTDIYRLHGSRKEKTMDAKKCDRCGRYYDQNNNTYGLVGYKNDCLTGIRTMHYGQRDATLDLCDGCLEKLIAWLKGDAE